MIGSSSYNIFIDTCCCCYLKIITERDEIDSDLCFNSGMNLFRPDDAKVIIGSNASFEWHEEWVIGGISIIVVGDFGRRGIDVSWGKTC